LATLGAALAAASTWMNCSGEDRDRGVSVDQIGFRACGILLDNVPFLFLMAGGNAVLADDADFSPTKMPR